MVDQYIKGDISKLDKPCAMRLYDSLKQWEHRGRVTFSIEWMISRYELPIKYLDRMSDFRRRFLKPAVNEINSKTSITVQYEELKGKGKSAKPSLIQFMITPTPLVNHAMNDTVNLDNAIKTYRDINDNIKLPNKSDIENFEKYMPTLLDQGFDMGVHFGKKLKKAKQCDFNTKLKSI